MNRVALRRLALAVLLAGPFTSTACGASPDPELGRLLGSVVHRGMADEHLPGVVVAVVESGKLAALQSFGVADVVTGRPVDPEHTLFRIGSITKVFTMMALAEALEQSGGSLDDPVTPHLGGVSISSRFDTPVTFRHLMTHSAGFDQIGRGRQSASTADRPSLSRFLAGELVLVRPPGRQSTYDTYGATLAGHLIETLSQRPYAEFMRDGFFRKLGMSGAGIERGAERPGEAALGYGYSEAGFLPQRYEYYNTTPASAADLTGRDMARFLLALTQRNSAPKLKAIATTAVGPLFEDAPGIPAYSFGLWEGSHRGKRYLFHGGTMLGYTSSLVWVPELGHAVFIAYNRDPEAGGGASRLRQELADSLMQRWFPEAASPVFRREPAVPIDTRDLEGAYAWNMYCHTCNEGDGGWPMRFAPVRSAGAGTIELEGERWYAVDSLTFESGDGSRIAFRRDESGTVRYLVGPQLVRERLSDALLDEVLGPGWRTTPAAPLAAQVYRFTDRFVESARAYQDIADRRPEDSEAQYLAGAAWLRAGEPLAALAPLRKGWASGQRRDRTGYPLIVAATSAGQISAALEYLRETLAAGFSDFEDLDEDPRLARLRADPRFAAVRR